MQLHLENDSDRTVCVSAVPVREPDGSVIAAVGIVEDITAMRVQDAEKHRLRAQADFLATMSHELRSEWGVSHENLSATHF